ncbi:PLP-dependent aminotransferase family protein [Paucibacter sp. AS339]|uniref:aminotransferase-like domain-containing protein n=1 Tax=Paucibacter hankyongi TaxID=3133434 RepID=UPI0030AEEC53
MDWLESPSMLGAWRENPGPLYAALASALQGLLLRGELLPGDRLPPERRLAEQLGLSRSTVVAAYARLAEGGWVGARQGQGTTVLAGPPGHVAAGRHRTAMGSPVLARRPAQRADWVDFSLATAVPDLAWLTPSEATQRLVLRESAYQPEGLLALRERIAARYSRQGLPTTPEQILVCAGAQQAISLVAQHFLGPGDRVLLEDPNYFGAIDVLRSSGAHLQGIAVQPRATHANAFIEALERNRPKLAYVCPGLHNPTGQSWSASASHRLGRAVARSGTLLLVDDSLSELCFTAVPPPLPAAPGTAIVHVGSLSKTLWAGLRVGWLRAPPAIMEALRRTKTCADIASSSLTGAIACDLFDRLDALIEPRRNTLQTQCQVLLRAIGEQLPGWRVRAPDGGLFLWAKLPAHGPRASTLTRAAERAGVRLTPGTALTLGPDGENFVRLAFTQTSALALEGVRRLASLDPPD